MDSYRFDFAGRMGVNDSKLHTVPQTRTHEPFQLSACHQEVDLPRVAITCWRTF